MFYSREICDINSVKQTLFEKQEEDWKHNVQNKPKLRFYRQFKENIEVENYVKFNLTVAERSITAQFRSGILPLHIETGRFRNTHIENRICTLCQVTKS